MPDTSECRQQPGILRPVVSRGDCEGKRECEEVCPYDVFEVRRIEDADYRTLSFFSRLKVRAHGMLTAYTPNEDACRTCGQCVSACPEEAIQLRRV